MSQEITADTIRDLFASQNIKCKGSRSSKDKMFRDVAAEVNFLHDCFERGSVIARQAQSKIEQYSGGITSSNFYCNTDQYSYGRNTR